MRYHFASKLFFHLPILSYLLLVGCEPKPTIGHDEPVTTERLVGTRLTDIRVKDLAWQFDESTVTIEMSGETLPEDFATKVVGTEGEYKEITAAWKYDDTGNALVLTEIKVDGEPVEGERLIDITPAGPIRVNLGSRQYNMGRSRPGNPPDDNARQVPLDQSSMSNPTNEAHSDWVSECLREMETIKPGMTRADLLRVFREEGGLSTRTERRYVFRDCPYFKINVKFEAVGNSESGEESLRDRIKKISQPFLEWSIRD